MPVLYHIKATECFECDERILPRILGLEKKDENEATEKCVKRNFVTFTTGQILLGHEVKRDVMGEACRTCGCNVKYFIHYSKQNTRTNRVRDVGMLLP
jgi:hypothetical protein